jgi:thiol-disulfide isomerase/thioredoxin
LGKAALYVLVLTTLLVSTAFAALKLNDIAPAFSLRDGGGHDISLKDILTSSEKEKVSGVIVSFFATWCAPCRQELVLLNSLADDLKRKGIKIILVDMKEDFNSINALLAELNVDKPVVLSDLSGATAEQYQIRFLPTTFFIGRDGKVKDIIFGEIKGELELRRSVGKLVQ